MMQAQVKIDAGLVVDDALQLAQRLASSDATDERVAFSLRLRNACRLHEKSGSDDTDSTLIDPVVFVCSAQCLRIVGDLLAAQAVAERGLLHHPVHVPLVDELVAVHEALAKRYKEVSQRYQQSFKLGVHPSVGSDG